MQKGKIILIGGGGHCRSCIDVIEKEGKFSIMGILDLKEKLGEDILGYKIIGTDNDLASLTQECNNFFVTIGHIKSVARRVTIFNSLIELGVNIPTIISPFSYISKHSSLGKGTIAMHASIINAGAIIGDNCILNSNSLIEHDAIIGNHCHVSTGAIINGGVDLGEKSFFGSGAVSIQNTIIPKNSFIPANSVAK